MSEHRASVLASKWVSGTTQQRRRVLASLDAAVRRDPAAGMALLAGVFVRLVGHVDAGEELAARLEQRDGQ
jgi:hypothetical protein